MPDVAVPQAVHAAQQELKSFSCALAGAFLPFPQAKIVERYKDRDDYVNRIRLAARALQAEGFLLTGDAAVIINAATTMRWPDAKAP